ncbi:SDR family NAD(P)-dependent oxidoreductase [Bordetella pseudohinzii]|uniref:3-oxoacyl-[acyl-carrier-protein] reductase FabG n=1 Tax=Bordetella pseudohinzii TaxID=1331258 RepID=A0A0J6C1A4_9BORD|nr:SDR family oxidoreductase [Bordetella pseudohinzii]ANY17733.1 short-chain dehydrogenase [Bordetella pseudohinzii]KMM24813.1 short-chain dehydrogenase [Bordetella pseudohinzii]KXA77927.1 short-chain dehydrogenase [Bordetella pseudohinzii]KXA79666.1 short-chain dehydrogenase [Bordetella pseudohinzii]CUJ02390.1 3-oxoacyl-[acyl-carrier-protein] reductase FabG [Bordetella pseudohinzii]
METVLLTGAASGIGRATARQLALGGRRCVLVDRNAEALRSLADALGGAHLTRVADLTDPAQIAALAEGLPPLHALINNAGMTDDSNPPVIGQDPAGWRRLLDLNLRAPARLPLALRERLVPGARIINVASGAGLRAIPWRGAYSPSKAGLIAQTRAMAREFPAWRFTVLCPGFVRTELVAALIQAGRLDPARAVAKIPLGRLGEPQEIACALAFLASAESASLKADLLAVDGGSSVFGGSQAYPPCAHAPMAYDTPLALRVQGPWDGPLQTAAQGYPALLDTQVLASPPGRRLDAIVQAARQAALDGPGSLTLLLPRDPDESWEGAGERAAARMLISTLACEWGPKAARINAVEVPPGADLAASLPLLRFVAGAQAQYLTGQTLGSP